MTPLWEVESEKKDLRRKLKDKGSFVKKKGQVNGRQKKEKGLKRG